MAKKLDFLIDDWMKFRWSKYQLIFIGQKFPILSTERNIASDFSGHLDLENLNAFALRAKRIFNKFSENIKWFGSQSLISSN